MLTVKLEDRKLICLVKPDNIVVSANRKTIKICDLNSAIPVDESIVSEDVVSRFYRAPEIILGCPFNTQIDVWAAGCTLFEIYTGQFLFPGSSNNQMLKLMMQAKGRFNNKYLRRGSFTSKHFDDDYNFLSREIDPITKEVCQFISKRSRNM
jgi:serine/threonine-protein kinase PRP4